MEVTFQYNQHIRTTAIRCGDVIYTVLWPWPEVGVHGIDNSVYTKEDGVWHRR